ncbi:MAG: response regulator [Alphaproteobacteria bacterium]|nr:response regulator [Alphaproteobacteria bacterium]
MVSVDDVRIIVIDDEEFVRNIIVQILGRLHIRKISQAADGAEGMKQTLVMKPHLVLCDIHMEPVGGMKYLSTIRGVNQPQIAKTPVIFLTSDAGQEKVMRARELNVSGYMVKPVSVNDVKKQINRVLGVEFP